MSAPTKKPGAPGEGHPPFLRSSRAGVPIFVWNPDDSVGVRDVEKFGIGPGRMEGESERAVQTFFGKKLRTIRFSAVTAVSDDLDLIRVTFADENIPVWRGKEKTRIA